MFHWHFRQKRGPGMSGTQLHSKAMPARFKDRTVWTQMYIYPRQIPDCQGLHNVHAKSWFCKYFSIFSARNPCRVLSAEAICRLWYSVFTKRKKMTHSTDQRLFAPAHFRVRLDSTHPSLLTCSLSSEVALCPLSESHNSLESLSHFCLLNRVQDHRLHFSRKWLFMPLPN